MRIATFIGLSVLCMVAGQILVKMGLDKIGGFSLMGPGFWGKVLNVMSSPLVWLGLGVTALSALFWFDILSTRSPSWAYPFLSLAFVVMQLASRLLFHEPIPALRWLGLVLICLGAVVIART